MTTSFDVIVLGAGIVGVSTALHLQARGRSVALIDRRGPGEETSYGNAGLIERSSVIPYAFPREPATVLRFALNRSSAVRYHFSFLPRIAPWLWQYWRQSAPKKLDQVAADMLPLLERCISEHAPLIEASGAQAWVREGGWLEVAHDAAELQEMARVAHSLGRYKLTFDVLDARGLAAIEPALGKTLAGAVHWRDPWTVSSPGDITKAYARLFTERGGTLLQGDARSLRQADGIWSVDSADGPVSAREVVVALGSWSTDVLEPLGYRLPLAVKRGYHVHFKRVEGTVLERPMVSERGGFVLSPMVAGIRMTSGIEIAPRDAAPTPVQIDQDEVLARQLLPLGERVEATPWMGVRPCFPDMKPVIGAAGRHAGLWLNFGHAHHGFTLGPVSGRILAERMTGEAPVVDLNAFRVDRF